MKYTTSLCDVCYKEIPAIADAFDEDVAPHIYKTCPEHGMQRGMLEIDREFYGKFNNYERRNFFPILIINVTDTCNIKCKHCYYPVKNSWHMPLEEFKRIIRQWSAQGFKAFLMSGGDPTCWKHYFEAGKWANDNGIALSQLTNGVLMADDDFWEKSMVFVGDRTLKAEISIHPSNISSKEVRDKQFEVLRKLRERGLKVSCIMQNVDTRSKVGGEMETVFEEIMDFMSEWRDVTHDFRIRPICFDAWGEPRQSGAKYYLSDLVKMLMIMAAKRNMKLEYSYKRDIDNIYNQNFLLDGMSVVTVCAANIQHLDIGYLNRGPFMLANDGKPYSVPHAIIVNEGIDKGWYKGVRLDTSC